MKIDFILPDRYKLFFFHTIDASCLSQFLLIPNSLMDPLFKTMYSKSYSVFYSSEVADKDSFSSN